MVRMDQNNLEGSCEMCELQVQGFCHLFLKENKWYLEDFFWKKIYKLFFIELDFHRKVVLLELATSHLACRLPQPGRRRHPEAVWWTERPGSE